MMQGQIVFVVIGTRPEAIKLAPVVRALIEADIDVRVCLTGQHTDLLAHGLAGFELPVHHELAVMSDNQDPRTVCSRIMEGLSPILLQERPIWVVVQGDTVSAFAAALTAFHHRLRVAHVEAGLRTGDTLEPWPGEMYRRLLGQLATLHFAPTAEARANLLAEGVDPRSILVTGNTIIDALRFATARVAEFPGLAEPALAILRSVREGRHLVLATVHRRENFGPPLEAIGVALIQLAARGDCDIVVPAHPNPSIKPLVLQLAGHANVHVVPPLEYFPFTALLREATLILTDSEGIQEEAAALGKPVLVLRGRTERPEVIAMGNGRLVGSDAGYIVREAGRLLGDFSARAAMQKSHDSYGDGHAARRIVTRILDEIAPTDLPRSH
jgi:UDP-N-acetylglucosamine 2-epimerase (non-hydrolysing)